MMDVSHVFLCCFLAWLCAKYRNISEVSRAYRSSLQVSYTKVVESFIVHMQRLQTSTLWINCQELAAVTHEVVVLDSIPFP